MNQNKDESFCFAQRSSFKRTFVSEDNILKKASKEDVSYGGHDYSFDKKNEYTSDQMARLLHTHDRIRSKTFSRNDSLLLEQLHKRIRTPEEEPARKHVNDGKHASKIQKRYTLHGTFGRKSSSKLPKSVGSKDYAKSNQYLSDLRCGSSSALHDPSFCNGNIQNKQTSSLGNLNRIFRMSKDANNEENNKINTITDRDNNSWKTFKKLTKRTSKKEIRKNDIAYDMMNKKYLHKNGSATFGKGSKISKIYLENIENHNNSCNNSTQNSIEKSLSKTSITKSIKKPSIRKSLLNFFRKKK